MIDWSFTSLCNLDCPFCRGFAHAQLDRAQTLRLAAEMGELRPERVILEGGEPFLREDLPDVVALLGEADIPTTIFTNGTAVRFDWLAQLRGAPVDVAVSVDAEEEAAYRRLRPGADRYAVWRTILRLRDDGLLSGVVITASTLNLAEVLPVVERARASGVPSATVIPMKPGPTYDELHLSARQKASLYRQIATYRKETGYSIFVDEPFFEPCFGRAADNPGGPVAGSAAGCIFGRYLFLGADGGVAPCTFADIVVGSAAETPLASLWEAVVRDPAIAAARDRGRRGGGCTGCPDLESCGGCRVVSAAVMGGDLCAADPYCPRNWKEYAQ